MFNLPPEKKAAWIYRARLCAALLLPVFLETLDYTVVATAQPHIASAFNRLDLQSYIGTVYLLTATVFLPVFAAFADAYGRFAAMESSLFFFLLGSALSTGARSMPMMLAGRGIAGIGAAGLLSVVRIILSDSSSLDDNNWQSAVLVFLYAVGFCCGPVVGGALTSVNFRWVFAINLPCATVSIVLVFLLLRNHTKGPQPPALKDAYGPDHQPTPLENFMRIDWIGAFFFVVGGILILLGLNWGAADESWKSARVIVCLIIGGILLLVMFGWEYILERKQQAFLSFSSNHSESEIDITPPTGVYSANALIPIPVFTNWDICATSYAAFCSGMVMLVIFYFIAIFMVIVSGLSAVSAGVQLVYFAPGMGGGTLIAIRLVKMTRQPKVPIVLGTSIIPIALGLISMAIANNSSQSQINGFMVLTGVGVGMTFGPLAIHARFSQPEERVAVVVALNLFFRSLGGTVGLAQCSTVLNVKVHSFFSHLSPATLASLEASGITADDLSASSLSSIEAITALPSEVQQIIRDAFRDGVRWCFISLIPWSCLAVFATLTLSKIRERPLLTTVDESPNLDKNVSKSSFGLKTLVSSIRKE